MATSAAMTDDVVRRLRRSVEASMEDVASRLVERVAGDLGRPGRSAFWESAGRGWVREFFDCLATDDGDRILAPGSIFEEVGAHVAREGTTLEVLLSAIRMSNRLVQKQVHLALLQEEPVDPDLTLELLERVLLLGELVMTAAQRGHDVAAIGAGGEEALAQRLAAELVRGGDLAASLAGRLGWSPTDLAVAVLASPRVAYVLRKGGERPTAWLRREHDVVLAFPVRLAATALRPRLAEAHVAVGPAVPLDEFSDSVDLAERTADLRPGSSGPVFADDHLLEVVAARDHQVLRALRRKHLLDIDELPDEVRTALIATLREWLLRWGHRPSVAQALYVHPQTVSGRINRLKDLLADDLEDPRVRSELLVLLVADTGEITGATRQAR